MGSWWCCVRTEKLVGLVGVLTVTLLAVSLTFLVYEWYLVNGLSVTVFVFPITRVEVNPNTVRKMFFASFVYCICVL